MRGGGGGLIERYQNFNLPKYNMKDTECLGLTDDHMCGLKGSFPENTLYKLEGFSAFPAPPFFTFDVYRHQTAGSAASPRWVVTSVRKSRGILSLDKHVALSAAVNFLEWQLAQSGILG